MQKRSIKIALEQMREEDQIESCEVWKKGLFSHFPSRQIQLFAACI